MLCRARGLAASVALRWCVGGGFESRGGILRVDLVMGSLTPWAGLQMDRSVVVERFDFFLFYIIW